MPRKARLEKRLLAEQATVGQLRDERTELENAARQKKVEAPLLKAQREARRENRASEGKGPPPRIPRAGKPLKRSR